MAPLIFSDGAEDTWFRAPAPLAYSLLDQLGSALHLLASRRLPPRLLLLLRQCLAQSLIVVCPGQPSPCRARRPEVLVLAVAVAAAPATSATSATSATAATAIERGQIEAYAAQLLRR